MAKILIIGAGVTGAYTAARLVEGGSDVSLLARAKKPTDLIGKGCVYGMRSAMKNGRCVSRLSESL